MDDIQKLPFHSVSPGFPSIHTGPLWRKYGPNTDPISTKIQNRKLKIQTFQTVYFTDWSKMFQVVVVETNYSFKLKLKLNNWNLVHSLRMTFRNFHSILYPQGSQVFIQAHCGKKTDPIQTQFQSKYIPASLKYRPFKPYILRIGVKCFRLC